MALHVNLVFIKKNKINRVFSSTFVVSIWKCMNPFDLFLFWDWSVFSLSYFILLQGGICIIWWTSADAERRSFPLRQVCSRSKVVFTNKEAWKLNCWLLPVAEMINTLASSSSNLSSCIGNLFTIICVACIFGD